MFTGPPRPIQKLHFKHTSNYALSRVAHSLAQPVACARRIVVAGSDNASIVPSRRTCDDGWWQTTRGLSGSRLPNPKSWPALDTPHAQNVCLGRGVGVFGPEQSLTMRDDLLQQGHGLADTTRLPIGVRQVGTRGEGAGLLGPERPEHARPTPGATPWVPPRAEAAAWGLVSRVVPDDELRSRAGYTLPCTAWRCGTSGVMSTGRR
jgi:hypothetical protein